MPSTGRPMLMNCRISYRGKAFFRQAPAMMRAGGHLTDDFQRESMPVYAYRGCNVLTHADVSGERFSDNAAALAAALRREQIVPITIRETRSARLDFFFWKRVSQVELALFTRQFSVMLQARFL